MASCGTTEGFYARYTCPYNLSEADVAAILETVQVINIRPSFFNSYCGQDIAAACAVTDPDRIFASTGIPDWQYPEIMAHEACHFYEFRSGVGMGDSRNHVGWGGA